MNIISTLRIEPDLASDWFKRAKENSSSPIAISERIERTVGSGDCDQKGDKEQDQLTLSNSAACQSTPPVPIVRRRHGRMLLVIYQRLHLAVIRRLRNTIKGGKIVYFNRWN